MKTFCFSGIKSLLRDPSSKPVVSNGRSKLCCCKKKKSLPDNKNVKASSSESNRTLLQNVENFTEPKQKEPRNSDPELYSKNFRPSVSGKRALSKSDFFYSGNFSELRPNGRAHTVAVSKPYDGENVGFQNRLLSPDFRQQKDYRTKKRSVSCFVTSEKSKKDLVQQVTKTKKSSRAYREHRVTVLLKFILLCFILLWLPYSLTVVVAALCSSCKVPTVVWNLSYWLCYLNSTVNPFCYGLCNENFRRTFKAILTTRWWTEKSRKMLRAGRKNPVAHQRGFKNKSLGNNSSKTKV